MFELLVASHLVLAQYNPPPGYHFSGRVIMTEVETMAEAQALCRVRAAISGCSWGGKNVGLNWCRIVYMRSQASWVIAHEMAHCGGWNAHRGHRH